MATGWFVYRCETHRRTTYVRANPPAAYVEVPPPPLCCEGARLVDLADEQEFFGALRSAVTD